VPEPLLLVVVGFHHQVKEDNKLLGEMDVRCRELKEEITRMRSGPYPATCHGLSAAAEELCNHSREPPFGKLPTLTTPGQGDLLNPSLCTHPGSSPLPIE
jgi:hypothetical protein